MIWIQLEVLLTTQRLPLNKQDFNTLFISIKIKHIINV